MTCSTSQRGILAIQATEYHSTTSPASQSIRPTIAIPDPESDQTQSNQTQSCHTPSLVLPPSIAIIIPVHNGGTLFATCLSHLAQLDPQPDELIIVADGDTDGSRDRAREFGAKVLVNATAQGPALARNRGAQQAKSDILFFVDADVALPADALRYIQQTWQETPTLAALIGSYDDAPLDPGFLSQYRNLLHHYTHQVSSAEAFTFWGACGVIRRDVFLELGGFDEAYELPSIEDIELGLRLKQAGYDIRLDKHFQVKHMKRWTAYSILKTDIFQRALPWSRLLVQSDYFVGDLNLSTVNRLSAMLVGSVVVGLPLSLMWPAIWALTLFACAALLVANAPLYHFFLRRRDLWFMLGAIPWHWLYYLYSLLCFATVFLLHKTGLDAPSSRLVSANLTPNRVE